MKLLRDLAGMACLITTLCSPGAMTTGDDVQLRISVTMVKQGDSPIQIIGLKMPSRINGKPTVLFRNVAGKEIRRLSIVGTLGNPDDPIAKSSSEYRNIYVSGPKVEETALALRIGDSGEDASQLPRSDFIVKTAMSLHSNCVHMAVMVNFVEFADGTKWFISTDRESALWQHSLTPDIARPCDLSVTGRNALAGLHGSAFQGSGQPSHVDQSTHEYYSYSCTMFKDENYAFAHCPF